MKKSYLCHEADPHVWEDIQMASLALLTRCDLDRYRELIPDDEDLQGEWEAAVDDPEKYVSWLIGQKNDDKQRAESDEENYHDPFEA